MQIHLAKPGGQKEGPFTLDQINKGISAGVFHDTDYWAWYEGLPEWVPLHRVLRSVAAPPAAVPPAAMPQPEPVAASSDDQFSWVKKGEPVVSTQQGAPVMSGVSAPEASTAAAVAAYKPVEEPAATVVSCPAAADAEPVVAAPSNLAPDPKTSVVSESDVVTALVQAVAEPELEAKPASPSTGFEPVPQSKVAQPAASPASTNASSSIEDLADVFTRTPAPAEVSKAPLPAEPRAATTTARKLPTADAGAPPADRSGASGLPFPALERMFIFSTGGRQPIWDSAMAAGMLKDIIGEDPGAIRLNVPRDVVFNCNLGGLMGMEGSLSDSVWQAMAARQPELIQRQRQGGHQVCVRTFRIESGAVIVLVLFYDNAKAGCQT